MAEMYRAIIIKGMPNATKIDPAIISLNKALGMPTMTHEGYEQVAWTSKFKYVSKQQAINIARRMFPDIQRKDGERLRASYELVD